MSNGIQVPSEFFWRTKFFPTSWTAVFSQVWRRSIFKFCVYKLAEAVRYLKFKWEFVIIGRGCLVVLKFKSSLCWRMLCFKALKRLCSFGIKLPCVNPTLTPYSYHVSFLTIPPHLQLISSSTTTPKCTLLSVLLLLVPKPRLFGQGYPSDIPLTVRNSL